jgi:hypothetical protein
MAVFISYSHADKTFVAKLAANLVKHNAHVWVDRWELNVGDSILNHARLPFIEALPHRASFVRILRRTCTTFLF